MYHTILDCLFISRSSCCVSRQGFKSTAVVSQPLIIVSWPYRMASGYLRWQWPWQRYTRTEICFASCYHRTYGDSNLRARAIHIATMQLFFTHTLPRIKQVSIIRFVFVVCFGEYIKVPVPIVMNVKSPKSNYLSKSHVSMITSRKGQTKYLHRYKIFK